MHKHYDDFLLKAISSITRLVITEKSDYGEEFCTVFTVSLSSMKLATSL